MTYRPRQGSTAENALNHLQGRGRMKSADLADAIEAEHGTMHASMNLAVEHGLVIRENAGGASYYCLPDERPPNVGGPVAPDPLPLGLAHLTKLPFGARQLQEQAPPPPQDSGKVTMAEARAAFREVENRLERELTLPHFEVGVFSDGRLMLEIGDERFTLSQEEKRKLLDFARRTDTAQ